MSAEVWSAITFRPSRVSPDDLAQPPHIRQCRVLTRARSRAEFARKLVASGVENRAPAAVAAWLRTYGGGPTRNDDDVNAVVDDGVYVTSLDRQGPYVLVESARVAQP